jgi:hypothetical protein
MDKRFIQVIGLLALISLASAYHTIPGCQPELGICTNTCEQIFTNLTNSNFTYMGGNQCTWNTENASINWTYYAVMTPEGCNDAGFPGGECAWFGFSQIGGDNTCPSYNTLGRQVNATDCTMDWNFDATKFNFNSDFFSGSIEAPCSPDEGICTVTCGKPFTIKTNETWEFDNVSTNCVWYFEDRMHDLLYYPWSSVDCESIFPNTAVGSCAYYAKTPEIVCPSYDKLNRRITATDCFCIEDAAKCRDNSTNIGFFNFSDSFFTTRHTPTTTTTTISEAAYLPPIHLVNGKALRPTATTIPAQQLQTQGFLEGLIQWLENLFQ